MRLEELRQRLLAKRYPLNLIEDAIRKAKTLDRQLLINPLPKQSNKEDTITLALVINRNPNYEDPQRLSIHKIGRKKAKNNAIKVPKIMTARRQPELKNTII